MAFVYILVYFHRLCPAVVAVDMMGDLHAGGAVFQPVLGYLLECHGRVEGVFTIAGYEDAFFALFLCGLIAFLTCLFLQETLAKA